MTGYDANVLRYMKEDYVKYSNDLEYEKTHNNNPKVIFFLERALKSLETNIKSYGE